MDQQAQEKEQRIAGLFIVHGQHLLFDTAFNAFSLNSIHDYAADTGLTHGSCGQRPVRIYFYDNIEEASIGVQSAHQ